MGIFWLSGIFMLIAGVYSGIFYRYDPFSNTNHSNIVAQAIADNLQSYATASMHYILNNSLNNATIINENEIRLNLPNAYRAIINYKSLYVVDSFQIKWLIVSYADINYAGLNNHSMGEDVLSVINQELNNKGINNQYNYQVVYVGQHNSCSLNSNIQNLPIELKNRFKDMCSNNVSKISKYVVMVPVRK